MPYASPSPSAPSSPTDVKQTLPAVKRPEHRRTRSSHAVYAAGANRVFASNAAADPPRRKLPAARKAPMFHFTEDQESESEDEQTIRVAVPPAVNTLGLTVDTTPLQTPSLDEPSRIPFPSKGSPTSPYFPKSAPIPRSPSSPVIFHNGRPLKPSLKSSHSSPHIPNIRLHTRAQSEPSTPAIKNVHFPEPESIQSVRVFNSAAKPANISKNPEETETDTDYDSSAKAKEPSSYFSSVSSSSLIPTYQIEQTTSSSIPHRNPPPSANLHLETAILPNTSPPLLRGSVLVRNIAFTKEVAVRFTLDDWQTTSEVICKHVVSLPDLPPPFEKSSSTLNSSGGPDPWDRFSFSIRLEDFERRLAERVLWLVVRYTVPGSGEWWDNNQGQNYRIAFQRSILPPTRDPTSPVGNRQSHSFVVPSTFRSNPTPLSHTIDDINSRDPPSRPAPVMPPIRSHQSMESVPTLKPPTPPMRTSLPSKLNLLNYSAPSKVTITPPSSRRSSLIAPATDGESTNNQPAPIIGGMIAGMPASVPPPELMMPSTSSGSSSTESYPTPTTDSPISMKPTYSTWKSPSGAALPSETEYADFIKKWCFAQSPSMIPQEPISSSPASPSILEKIQAENGWLELGNDLLRSYGGIRGERSMLAGM